MKNELGQQDLIMQKVAVVQAGTVLEDTRRTIEKLEQACSECAERNVKLGVFPKGFIGGYPKGMVFAASLGIRTDDARHLFQAYADGAIEVPGPMQLESTRSPSVLRGRWLSVSSSAMGDVVLLRAFLRTPIEHYLESIESLFLLRWSE